MKSKIPKKLLKSAYRKEMWKQVLGTVKEIEKVLPISSMHVMGSFVSKKTRPADVDFIVLLKTKKGSRTKNWSVDLVIAPDNKHGDFILKDAISWMEEKYGKENCESVRLI